MKKCKYGQEVPKEDITFDYPIIETSRVIVTTDEKLYKNLVENENAIPLFSPELLKYTSKDCELELDSKIYFLHIPLDI